MTDRYSSIVVVFEENIRDDDAENLLTAIRMLRGVLSVTPNIANTTEHIAYMRVRSEMLDKLLDVVK